MKRSRFSQPSRASDRRPARASDKKPAADRKPPRVLLTEDQADILYCEKHKHEPAKPLRDVLRKLGIDESEVGL